jgi:acyl carrier protein
VVLIEEHFHVTITDEEVGQVAFASVDALTDFIVANQNPSASPQP